jgi:hypothetical protein
MIHITMCVLSIILDICSCSLKVTMSEITVGGKVIVQNC